jgi:anthranilate phosphoribosyltransferase
MTSMTFKNLLQELVGGATSRDRQITLLKGMSLHDVTADDLVTSIQFFRERMQKIPIDHPRLVDLCGTGGDQSHSFNVSTTAAFVVAAAGVPVAKHGNVSITSRSGSIDLLRALSIPLPETPAAAAAQFHQYGICFLFAPFFHPIFAVMKEARRTLAGEGVRTIFNILGPLLNPVPTRRAAIGVFDTALMGRMATALAATGTTKALLFSGGHPGGMMDELSLLGPNQIIDLQSGQQTLMTKTPEDFGFNAATLADLKGGTPDDNAAITRAILTGKDQGPKKDMVLINAAAAIYVADDTTFETAQRRAADSLNSGKAGDLLDRMANKRGAA